MTQDTEQKIKELESKVSDLEQKITGLTNNPVGILTDPQSKDNISLVIEERIHEIMWDKIFYHSTVFESIDRYLTGGAGSAAITSSGLTMNNSAGAVTVFLQIDGGTILKPDKETYYSLVVTIDDVSEANFDSLLLPGSTGGYCGFSIDGGSIIGLSQDGTTTKTLTLGTVADGVSVLLEAVYYPGTRVEFFVDGTLTGTITENLRSTVTDVEYIAYFNLDPAGGAPSALAHISHYKILQKQD